MNRTTLRTIGIYVAAIGAAYLAGAVGSAFTLPAIPVWYAALAKPVWTPPAWLFAPVWNILYLLMGIAAGIIWQRCEGEGKHDALMLYFGQLAVNALWSVAFFGLKLPVLGLVVIAILWLMIVWMIIRFAPLSRTAAWILVPYLIWVSYATALNLGIVLLN